VHSVEVADGHGRPALGGGEAAPAVDDAHVGNRA
jgi:hypothetical protein